VCAGVLHEQLPAAHRLGVHSGGLFTFQVLFDAGVAT
jgi:hypothetical protein